MPQCKGVSASTGQPCKRNASEGSLYCFQHAESKLVQEDLYWDVTPEEQDKVKEAFKRAPFPGFLSLFPRQYLNDEVMNLYIEKLNQLNVKAYMFNTFMVHKMRTSGVESVRRWVTRAKVNVCEKDLLLFPVNDSEHWYLIAATRSRITVYDSILGYIQNHDATARLVKDLLTLEDKENKCETDRIIEIDRSTPQQPNDYDCGLYTLIIARALILGEQTWHLPADSKKLRYWLASNVLTKTRTV